MDVFIQVGINMYVRGLVPKAQFGLFAMQWCELSQDVYDIYVIIINNFRSTIFLQNKNDLTLEMRKQRRVYLYFYKQTRRDVPFFLYPMVTADVCRKYVRDFKSEESFTSNLKNGYLTLVVHECLFVAFRCYRIDFIQ